MEGVPDLPIRAKVAPGYARLVIRSTFLAAALAVAASSVAAVPPASYEIHELPALEERFQFATASGLARATMWIAGRPAERADFGSAAIAVNARGAIVFRHDSSAFVWTEECIELLEEIDMDDAAPTAIAESGPIVGTAQGRALACRVVATVHARNHRPGHLRGHDDDGVISGYGTRAGMTGLHGFRMVPLATEILGALDGDGVVGVPDLSLLIQAWGPCAGSDPCAAELDDDGSVPDDRPAAVDPELDAHHRMLTRGQSDRPRPRVVCSLLGPGLRNAR